MDNKYFNSKFTSAFNEVINALKKKREIRDVDALRRKAHDGLHKRFKDEKDNMTYAELVEAIKFLID